MPRKNIMEQVTDSIIGFAPSNVSSYKATPMGYPSRFPRIKVVDLW